MPSGIFPAMFGELGSKCCFEGLSSEPIYSHAEFAGRQGGVDSTQHLPGTSPLAQKRLFKGLEVHSGTKARDSKKEGAVQCRSNMLSSLHPLASRKCMGVRNTFKRLSQISSCCCLENPKCILVFFCLRSLLQHQVCPDGEHSPGCSPPSAGWKRTSLSREHPCMSAAAPECHRPIPALCENSVFPAGLTRSFKMYR